MIGQRRWFGMPDEKLMKNVCETKVKGKRCQRLLLNEWMNQGFARMESRIFQADLV